MPITTEQSEIISICPDPVISVDRYGVIKMFNPAAERLLGYSADEVVQFMNIRSLYPSIKEAHKIKQEMIEGGGRLEGFETAILAKDGREVPIRLSATLLKNGASIGFFHDMTRQKALESTLKKQSITDDLSGLFNQRHFYSQLNKEMGRAQRYGEQLSLICIDLDGFKQINDQLGHLEGDKIIRQIGGIFFKDLRDSDQAFRYGGDEFMLLLPSTDTEHAMALAKRVRKAFNRECLYSPRYRKTGEHAVSMSLGVSTSTGDEPADQLIQHADKAMYQAKQSGGDCEIAFCNPAED